MENKSVNELVGELLEKRQKRPCGEFTEEDKNLIHIIAKKCRNAKLQEEFAGMSAEYAADLSANDVFTDMIYKIANAPTRIHMMATVKLLFPILDEKIQNTDKKGELL